MLTVLATAVHLPFPVRSMNEAAPDSKFVKRQIAITALTPDDILELEDGRVVKGCSYHTSYSGKLMLLTFDVWPTCKVQGKLDRVPSETKFDTVTTAYAWVVWHKWRRSEAIKRGAD
jgi:hypothetical protein